MTTGISVPSPDPVKYAPEFTLHAVKIEFMSTFVIGDLHGHYNKYKQLLQSAGLCDSSLCWTGGDHNLWLIGDFFDRGNSGIDCVELTMSLQQEAARAGGYVNSILGNHELMILCAWRFRDRKTTGGMKVIDQWLTWGGVESDLTRMNETHVDWLKGLPAMVRLGSRLLLHADAMLYVNHGHTPEQVNAGFARLLESDDLRQWEITLNAFAEHRAFSELGITGKQRARQLLKLFGADQLIHGHTPISFANGTPPEEVTGAWTYADGLCINVDAGLYLGGPGFVYEIADP
ncbi:MAG: metallophosphoesterase [Pseudomonadales bacterium]|nr:metallophosphoesterase [Pseudomonadales bacterium]